MSLNVLLRQVVRAGCSIGLALAVMACLGCGTAPAPTSTNTQTSTAPPESNAEPPAVEESATRTTTEPDDPEPKIVQTLASTPLPEIDPVVQPAANHFEFPALKRADLRGLVFTPELEVQVDGPPPDAWDGYFSRTYFDFQNHVQNFCLGFSVDSRLMAVGYRHGIVRLWPNHETESQANRKIGALAQYQDLAREILAVAFSPDGVRLAAGDAGGAVCVRDLRADQVLWKLPSQGREILELAYSPDGKVLAAGLRDEGVQLFDVQSGAAICKIVGSGRFAFSPDGESIAVSADNNIQICQPRTGEVLRTLKIRFGTVEGMLYAGGGKLLVASVGFNGCFGNGELKYFRLADGVEEGTLPTQSAGRMWILPHKDYLLVEGQTPIVLNRHTGKTVCEIHQGKWGVSPDGRVLAGGQHAMLDGYDLSMLLNFPVRRALHQLHESGATPIIDGDLMGISYYGSKQPEVSKFKELRVPLRLQFDGQQISLDDWAKIAACPNVVELVIKQDESFSDQTLALIGKMTQLRALAVPRSILVTNHGVAHLAELVQLKSLDLSETSITSSGLAPLKNLTQLETLKLPDGALDDACVAVAPLKNLVELSMHKAAMNDWSLEYLAGLTRLKRLSLPQSINLTGAGLAHLASMKELESLELREGQQLTDEGLAKLPKLPRLKELNLAEVKKLNSAALQAIGQLESLEDLYLRDCDGISDADLAHLAGLKRLTRINLNDCDGILGQGLKVLAEIPGVTKLDFSMQRLSPQGVEILTTLKQLEGLEPPFGVTDEQVAEFGKLPNLKVLGTSSLYTTSGRGLIAVAKARGFKELRLNGTQAKDADLIHLRELPDLKELSLPDDITDAGMVHVGQLTKLEKLEVNGTQITDAGLVHLANLTHLREIDLTATKVTDRGLEQLQKLPGLCDVAHYHTEITNAEAEKFHARLGKYATDLSTIPAVSGEEELSSHLALSPDAAVILCMTSEGTLKAFDLVSKKLLYSKPEVSATSNFQFLPDGASYLLPGEKELVQYATRTGEVIGRFPFDANMEGLYDLRLSRDGKRIFGFYDQQVITAEFPPQTWSLRRQDYPIQSLDVDADGRWLVTADENETVCVWDVAKTAEIARWVIPGEACKRVGISRDGKMVVYGVSDALLRACDVATGRVLWELDRASPSSFAWSPDSSLLMYAAGAPSLGPFLEGAVMLKAATGEPAGCFRGHASNNYVAMALSADGQTLITSGYTDGAIKVWRLPAPKIAKP